MRFPILLGSVLVALLLAITVIAIRNGPGAERRKVFEQTWSIVNETFYDKSFNGLDWPAVRQTFSKKLGDATDSATLYRDVLNPMLSLLESSHVRAISPGNVLSHEVTKGPRAAMVLPSVEFCGGFFIAFPFRSIAPRITSVDNKSPLYGYGIRPNWRMHGITLADSSLDLNFVSTAGERLVVPVSAMAADSLNAEAIRDDFKVLGELLAANSDPTTELRMSSIGLTVAIGKNPTLPVVVDVRNGSQAERAGMEPGSTVTRYRREPGTDKTYVVDANFISPGGSEYSAKFSFPECDIPDRVAELLTADVLYLRFNRFQPEVVPWLDEQLDSNPNGIVLDLRTNAGGNVDVLLQLMGRFVDMGAAVAQDVRADETKILEAKAAPRVYRGPVAILISRLSSSAAEVAAAAFRHHQRGKLFGQTTSGDVLLSSQFSLVDGGSVLVAVADVRDPDGKRLENVGVKPDYEIMPTLETVRAGRDVVLEAALTDLKQSPR